jgi:4-amino-4-deoxy-L-arabinose transferase-like glycosyltransferase
VLTAYAVCVVGRRLFQGWGAREATAAGWLAGLLVALFPPLVAQTFILSDGPLTLALLTLGLMLLATLRDRRKVNARTVMLGVMGGLVIGLGALMSPALLPLLTLAVVWFLFRLPLPQTLLRVTPLVLVALLIVSSWPAGRSGAPAGDPLGQPLDLILYGILTVVALAGVAVSLRLWREVSLLWGLPLLAGAQALLLPSADLDPALAQPALFLFAGAALLWLRARTQARRTNQVRHDND